MTAAQPTPSPERRLLREPAQLTSPEQFVKAGEAYFNADASWIIFQAVPVPQEGEEPSPHYSMYVAKLERDASGTPTGIEEPILVSPPNSANTCGWFHPTKPDVILFGSTRTPPTQEGAPGYSRGNSKYTWQFPREMEVVKLWVWQIYVDQDPETRMFEDILRDLPSPIWERDGYDAEASWSPDGRSIMYTANGGTVPYQQTEVVAHDGTLASIKEVDTQQGDIWVYIPELEVHRPLVQAPGYDGGPFFSHDGKYITYRSDREQNNLLQIYVAELSFDDEGLPNGIANEYKLTDNEHVNWCPFWHPSGEFLVYATSEVGHFNYEVFAVPFDKDNPTAKGELIRVTHADGFDGLPVFNADGSLMMWTAQRDESGTSQLVISRTTPAFRRVFEQPTEPAFTPSGAGD